MILNSVKLNKNKKNVNITFFEYKLSFIAQPYFIFHRDFPNNEIPNIDQNGFELYKKANDQNKQNIENILQFLRELNEEEADENATEIDSFDFLEESLSELEVQWDYSQRKNAIIQKEIQKQAVDFLKNSLNLNEHEIYELSPSESLENSLINLQLALNNPNISLIINPKLGFYLNNFSTEEIDFYLKANLFAYDKATKTAYLKKNKSWTESSDYLKANFIFEVAKLTGLVIKNIKLIIFDEFKSNIEKGKIPFFITDAASSSNSKPKKDDNGEREKLRKKIVNGTFFKYENLDINFYSIVSSNINKIVKNPMIATDKKTEEVNFKWPKELKYIDNSDFGNFEDKIKQIVDSYFSKAPIYSKNGEFNLDEFLESTYGKDKEFNKLILFLYMSDKYYFSTQIKKITNILNTKYVSDFQNTVDLRKTIPNYFSIGAIELLSKYIKKDKRYIWYDYEGVTSIVPMLDNAKPYQQFTNQVSIIETVNGEIILKNNQICQNLLKDPLSLTLIDLVDILINVYANKADYYVVFNKTYENSRNNELCELVKTKYLNNDLEFIKQMEQIGINEFTTFESMVNHINNNTLDLRDFLTKRTINIEYKDDVLFPNNLVKIKNRDKKNIETIAGEIEQLDKWIYPTINTTSTSKQSIPTNMLNFNIFELFGLTGIKKVEKLITESQVKTKYHAYFKEYKDLDIKNGSMAMEAAINRQLNIIKDNEWSEKETELKKYCQNDVVAMLVTFDFFKMIILDALPEIEQYLFQIDNQIISYDKNLKRIILIDEMSF
ncbi:UU173 family protein [Mycoplasmopsis gallinarum]|uniref:UU173 family protein n=1 Tax=Mycoplasmopsis gallinarum TaxID=29557 RepID=UPI0004856439|nr:DUF2779 domain-containing protein [Mycoplasmopsis gallinarum]